MVQVNMKRIRRKGGLRHRPDLVSLGTTCLGAVHSAGICVISPDVHDIREILVSIANVVSIPRGVRYGIVIHEFVPPAVSATTEVVRCDDDLNAIFCCLLNYPIGVREIGFIWSGKSIWCAEGGVPVIIRRGIISIMAFSQSNNDRIDAFTGGIL